MVNNKIKIEDNRLVVNLKANSTTGYVWHYEIENEQLLECVDEMYIPFDYFNMAGAGGLYCAIFSPKLDGETSIVFNYLRSWEESAPIQTKTVNVLINQGQIYLQEEE